MIKKTLIMTVAMVMTIGTIGCTKKKDSNLTNETKEETKGTYVVEDDVTEQESSSYDNETEQESSSYDNETGNDGSLLEKIFGKESTTEEAQTEAVTEEVQTETKTEKPQKKKGKSQSPNKIAFFKKFYKNQLNSEYDSVVEYLEGVFGNAANVTDQGDTMNASGKMCGNTLFDYQNGISVLKESFNSMVISYDIDNRAVYTLGFHKNCDINIVEDNDPSSSECKESYDKLYKKLEDKFGSPSMLFTPEQNGYTGATWSSTNCGEVWLAWGDEIFGSKEPDCILSFSVKGE